MSESSRLVRTPLPERDPSLGGGIEELSRALDSLLFGPRFVPRLLPSCVAFGVRFAGPAGTG